MTRVSKRQLAARLSERADISRSLAGELLNDVLGVITDELAKGSTVSLTGFGTWRMRVQAPRVTRDVRTGRPVAVPPRTRVAFKAGRALRRAAESSIDAEVYFGDGIAPAAELDRIFADLFGEQQPVGDLGREELRARIREAVGEDAERQALDFFETLWKWRGQARSEPVES